MDRPPMASEVLRVWDEDQVFRSDVQVASDHNASPEQTAEDTKVVAVATGRRRRRWHYSRAAVVQPTHQTAHVPPHDRGKQRPTQECGNPGADEVQGEATSVAELADRHEEEPRECPGEPHARVAHRTTDVVLRKRQEL